MFRVIAVMIAVMVMGVGSGYAVTITWDGSVDGTWETGGNWDLNRIPNSTDNVIINNVGTAPIIIVAGALCGNLTFTTGANIALTITAPGTLLPSAGAIISASAANAAFTSTISGNGAIIAQGALTITNNANGGALLLISVSGAAGITGSGITLITFSGVENITVSSKIIDGATTPVTIDMTELADVVTFSGTNTYAGTTTINGGNLTVSGGDAIATASSVVLADDATAKLTISAAETIGPLSGGGSNGGNVALGATLTINQSSDGTYAGVISGGANAVTKTGAGALTLNGTNSYTGLTTLSNGTLAGTGTIGGALTTAAATILAPGATNGTLVGDLTVTGVITLNAASEYRLTVTPAGVDKIVAGNNIVTNGAKVTVQSGYNSVGLTLPASIIDLTGTFSAAFDETDLPIGWNVDNTKGATIAGKIMLTAAPMPTIPTLSEWGIILAFLLLAGAGVILIRRRQRAGSFA